MVQCRQEGIFQNELEKFIAVLFLRNADYGTYNKLMVEYRKSYANKYDTYPKSLKDVVDVMRQVQPKPKKPKIGIIMVTAIMETKMVIKLR